MIYLRNKMNILCHVMVIISALACIISSCNKNDRETSIWIDELVFFQIMDSLDLKHDLKNKQIKIGRYESDDVINYVKENLIEELENDTTGPGKMVLELVHNLGDSSYLEIENDNDSYNIEWGSTGKKFQSERISNEICVLYISQPVFTSNGKMGCFYLSMGQIENPGAYIIFIGNFNEKWEIISILKSWGYP
jgi:hypothetical protein